MNEYNKVLWEAVRWPVWRAVRRAAGVAVGRVVLWALWGNDTTWYPKKFNNPKL